MSEPEQREYPETLKPATKPQKAQTTSERRRLLGPANASAGFWTVPESVFNGFEVTKVGILRRSQAFSTPREALTPTL